MQAPLQQTQQMVAGLETQQRPIQEDQSGDQSAQEALPVSQRTPFGAQGTLSGAQLEQQPSPINQRSPSVDPSQQHQSPHTPQSEQQQSMLQFGGPDLSLVVAAIETGISYTSISAELAEMFASINLFSPTSTSAELAEIDASINLFSPTSISARLAEMSP